MISTSEPKIHLLPLRSTVTAEEVLSLAATGAITAGEFYVTGAEGYAEKPWGYPSQRLLNIAHHAPVSRMAHQVSSTNLALLYVHAIEHAYASSLVVIHHTDGDSVWSSANVVGILEPLAEYGEAAIAADHTGVPNAIADLLQALDSQRDYELSLHNLRRLQDGAALEPVAQRALSARQRLREAAASLVAQGHFTPLEGLWYATLEESIDGEFFPALLPEAVAILIFSPHRADRGVTERGVRNVKLRLGNGAPAGLSLHQVRVQQSDPAYGGRWNAGSNKRGGGTTLSPDAYADAVAKRLQQTIALAGQGERTMSSASEEGD